MAYRHLNVEAYDALLRHLLLEEPKKFKSFLAAHVRVAEWFGDSDGFSADDRVIARSNSHESSVAALRVLNLYAAVYALHPVSVPKTLYRDELFPPPYIKPGETITWSHPSRNIVSFSEDPHFILESGLNTIRMDTFDEHYVDTLPNRYRLAVTPPPRSMVWHYKSAPVVTDAFKYVDWLFNKSKHSKSTAVTTKLGSIRDALQELDETLSRMDDELEVVLYLPKPIKAKVVADIMKEKKSTWTPYLLEHYAYDFGDGNSSPGKAKGRAPK